MPNGSSFDVEVKRANQHLYDTIAHRYEEIDGRRSRALERWLRGRLRQLRARAGGGRLLDLGSGSGLIMRCAEGVFEQRVALDISRRMLELHGAGSGRVVGDVDELPFADASFDLVTCFAVLHHLPSFSRLAVELARVLRAGGLFYSDHDLDREFARRFRLPLAVYRALVRSERRCEELVDVACYRLSEHHHGGIAAEELCARLTRAGLSPEARYHWFGLTPLLDRVFGQRHRPRGWAPLLTVIATRRG